MINKIEQLRQDYKANLQSIDVLDINAWWDPYKTDCFVPVNNFEEWNQNITAFGINSAVVTHIDSVRYSAAYGNEKLEALLEEQGNLYGCMVLVPEMCFDGNPETYVDELLGKQFVAARMFPKSYFHSMNDYAVGRLLSILEERSIPLLLWHSEVSWDVIDRICKQYSKLPLIVEGHNVKVLYHGRNYISLLQEHENFYMETHNLVLFDEIKKLVNHYEASKLLYGSYYPYNTPNHSLFNVMNSRIDKEDVAAIMGMNAKTLISKIGI